MTVVRDENLIQTGNQRIDETTAKLTSILVG